MCREDNMICDENEWGFLVDELLTDVTKRSEQTDACNSSSPDAEPLEEGKDEPPRYQVEKEM